MGVWIGAGFWATGANDLVRIDDQEVRLGDERGKEVLSWGAGEP